MPRAHRPQWKVLGLRLRTQGWAPGDAAEAPSEPPSCAGAGAPGGCLVAGAAGAQHLPPAPSTRPSPTQQVSTSQEPHQGLWKLWAAAGERFPAEPGTPGPGSLTLSWAGSRRGGLNGPPGPGPEAGPRREVMAEGPRSGALARRAPVTVTVVQSRPAGSARPSIRRCLPVSVRARPPAPRHPCALGPRRPCPSWVCGSVLPPASGPAPRRTAHPAQPPTQPPQPTGRPYLGPAPAQLLGAHPHDNGADGGCD